MTDCKEKLSLDLLTDEFYKGCKNDEFLGLEYERLPINKQTKEAISYYGENGVCEILKEFAKSDNWDYLLDNQEIIGLKKLHNTITLEPGAQVELSITPQKSVNDLKSVVDEINNKAMKIFDKYGVTLLNYGIYPVTTYKNIKLIPKTRYKYMANYLWGILSDVMMRETAGIQVGIDFKDEEDALKKFNLANKLSPFMTAMFANSKIRGGVDTGYKSFRALAWLNTDNERCGFGTKFNDNMKFEDYVKQVLSVPVIYIVRNGQYLNVNGKINFEQFINNGWEGFDATLDDFKLHSNLYFPEVRLRSFIEIRNHDCVEEKYMYSLLSAYKAIFYNTDALDETISLLKCYTVNDISELRHNVARFALNTKIHGLSIKDITQEILNIAEYSLNTRADSDLKYLYPIIELNKKGIVPADIDITV